MILKRLNRWLKQQLEPYCYWWATNENAPDERGGHRREAWIYRRAWLHFKGRRYRQLSADWLILPRMGGDLGLRFGVSLDFGGPGCERDVKLYLGLIVATFYFSCSGFFPRLGVDYEGRTIEINWHSRGLWWRFWVPEMSWSSRTPKWRDGHFDPTDFVLGQTRCETTKVGDPIDVVVPMPEANYRGTVQLERRVWKRPRWPWPTMERTSASISMIEGVPVPGKGENSWDCGEGAIHGTGSSEATPEAAVAQVVEAALEDRRRYGGSLDWRPSAVAEGEAVG